MTFLRYLGYLKFDVTDKKKKAQLSALSNQENIFAKMSFEVEEDTELRDLVTSALQTSGVLGKIKAQLRSNVYLAIEGEDELKVLFMQFFCPIHKCKSSFHFRKNQIMSIQNLTVLRQHLKVD